MLFSRFGAEKPSAHSVRIPHRERHWANCLEQSDRIVGGEQVPRVRKMIFDKPDDRFARRSKSRDLPGDGQQLNPVVRVAGEHERRVHRVGRVVGVVDQNVREHHARSASPGGVGIDASPHPLGVRLIGIPRIP